MELLDFVFLLLFGLSQTVLLIFGLHYFYIVRLYLKNAHQYRQPSTPPQISSFPSVTIQIPIYNEKYVILDMLRAIIALEYPRTKFEIQILDDSDDETIEIVAEAVQKYQVQGYNIQHLRRGTRAKYKAGALNYGLISAQGELIAIFDADFIPPKSFLLRCVPYFEENRRLGCLQTRWGHQNEKETLLTRTIALGIDGHFIVEQNVRATLDIINFNGTCGIWRKNCIVDAGGWDGMVLAEDLDLSYRAHLKGWQIQYLPDLVCLGEIPSDIRSFKQQQYRWAKGSIQSARKNIRLVWHSPYFDRGQKVEASFHHFGYFIQFFMLLLMLTTVPLIPRLFFIYISITLIFSVFALAAPSMYFVAAHELNRPLKEKIITIFLLTLLGIGISWNTGRGAFLGIFQTKGEFKRTPKRGKSPVGYLTSPEVHGLVVELGLALYALFGVYFAIIYGNYFALPFLLLYVLGLSWVALLGLSRISLSRVSIVHPSKS